MIAASAVALLLAASPLDPWIPNPSDRTAAETAWNTLLADADRARDIHAYYRHLVKRPSLLHTEALALATFRAARSQNALHTLLQVLDEEPDARQLYAETFAEPQPEVAVRFNALVHRADETGVRYLQSHAADGVSFLMSPAMLQPLPGALEELRVDIRYDRELREELRDAAAEWYRTAEAHPAYATWWRRVYSNGDDDLTKAFLAFESTLDARPTMQHAWETRNRAWARESPESLASMWRIDERHRRTPALERVRRDWLDLFLRQPDAWDEFDAAFRSRDDAPTWPLPLDSLPAITSSTDPRSAAEREQSREELRPAPARPERPSATTPPTRPDPNLGGQTTRPVPPTPAKTSETP